MKPDLTKQQWAKAVKLRKDGMLIKPLAKLLDIPEKRLSDGLKERGASTKNGLYSNVDISKPTYREVAAVRAYWDSRTPLNVISEFWQINSLEELKLARAKMVKHGMF